MPRRLRPLTLTIPLLLSLACSLFTGPVVPVTPALPPPTDQSVPSATPLPLPTGLPPAPSPTAPAEISPTPPDPTEAPPPAGLNPAGPYVLFRSPAGLSLANPDGSFPTSLTTLTTHGDLRGALSPAGDRLALVSETETGLDLVLVSLPGGAAETIAQLSTFTVDAENSNAASPEAFAAYAIRDYPSVAWQPGSGRLLAFIAALNGPTADVYLYDTETRALSQLTDGPSQAVLPSWSPDGQYLLHAGVSWVPPFGGAIVGPTQLDGIWAVRLSDGALIDLPKPAGLMPNFAGWLDAGHYLTYDSDETCYSQNLRQVAVADGAITPLMEASFYYFLAHSPANGALVFSSAAGCPTSLGEGTFLLLPNQPPPVPLLPKRAYGVTWLPESQVFQAYPEALFSADGQTRYDPPVYERSYNPAVSAAGDAAWEVIENQQGRVVVQSPGADWRLVLEGSVATLLWDPVHTRTLLIALRDGSLYSAAYPDFEPVLQGQLGGRVDQAIWVP